MSNKYVEHTIGAHRYRIGRLSAADGTWVAKLMTRKHQEARAQAAAGHEVKGTPETKLADVPIETVMLMTANFLIAQMSRQEIAEVQAACMAVIDRYEEHAGAVVPMPLIINDGQWKDPDMEFEGPIVLDLMQRALAFNIARYFTGAGSSETTIAPASNQQGT